MTFWVVDWLRVFGLTVVIEELVAVPLLGRWRSPPSSAVPTPPAKADARWHMARRMAAVLLVNLATHPPVWFLFPGLSVRYPLRVAVSELWAFSAEGAAYLIIWPELGARRAGAGGRGGQCCFLRYRIVAVSIPSAAIQFTGTPADASGVVSPHGASRTAQRVRG